MFEPLPKVAPEVDATSTALSCARALLGILPRLRRFKAEFLLCAEGQKPLTLPQFFVMGYLHTGERLPSHLSQRLMVSMPTITSVVDGLVTRGLVERISDPGDRRRVKLQLTQAGRRLYEKHLQAMELGLSRRLFHLTPEQQERLCMALGDLQQVLEASQLKENSKI